VFSNKGSLYELVAPPKLKTSYSFEVIVPALRSVARIRLVETDDPNSCATVNWKVCKSAIAPYVL
jgi:hypothetical protein